jgi:hypothetical protein
MGHHCVQWAGTRCGLIDRAVAHFGKATWKVRCRSAASAVPVVGLPSTDVLPVHLVQRWSASPRLLRQGTPDSEPNERAGACEGRVLTVCFPAYIVRIHFRSLAVPHKPVLGPSCLDSSRCKKIAKADQTYPAPGMLIPQSLREVDLRQVQIL